MAVKVIELMAEHGGMVGLVIGLPFIALCSAIVVLWRQNTKNQERLVHLIEQKVEADTRLVSALDGLKEVIQAQRGRA
jgi:hypothetical protein